MSMLELTQDSDVIIIWRKNNLLIYYNFTDQISSVIVGHCDESNPSCSGKYELDCPVTPDNNCNCGLQGVWI